MGILHYLAAQIVDSNALPQVKADNSTFRTGLNIFFAIIGAISFLMMVIAGLNYILSQGNPDKVARSRNTIIYAGVGLAISASAALIVSLVLSRA